MTSVLIAEVSKQAHPPQQQPTTPMDDAPSALAYARRAFTLESMPSHLTVFTHPMNSSIREPRSKSGGRPSPSVPPSNAGWRTLGTYVRYPCSANASASARVRPLSQPHTSGKRMTAALDCAPVS